MKKKTEKGFALVLSIVLLLVMSLMGGSLIVISAGDHQSNNTSDEYQQTFYVAETALLEAEKIITNKMMGPWIVVDDEYATPPACLNAAESEAWNAMEENLKTEAAVILVKAWFDQTFAPKRLTILSYPEKYENVRSVLIIGILSDKPYSYELSKSIICSSLGIIGLLIANSGSSNGRRFGECLGIKIVLILISFK